MVQSLDDARRRSQRSPGDRGGASGSAGSAARVPPHNLQAEESLLGAMLLSRDAIAAAVETCSADDFYKPAHGHVFDAVCSLYAQGEPADPVTVADELRRADLLDAIGGPATLITLQANTPATTNAGRYARIVEEHALLRRLIGVAGEIAEMGYGVPEDVAMAVDRAETLVFEVAERRVTDSLRPLHDLLSESLDRLEALYDRGEAITGVPTGFLDLDERLSGLQPSSLVIVGARPSMGKTALALSMAAHASMNAHVPVLFFSLEMSHSEVTQRLLCSEARVNSTRIRNGRLHESDWPKISHAIGRLGEAPLYIDDNPNLTVMEIRAKARRLRSRLGALGLIVVDYLQLMTGRNTAENRQVEVSEISRGLKILARELEVPVVALSQLSRNLELRADKRPALADLRESGCMPASTRLLRADNGEEVTLGSLVLTQEQPLVWSVDEHQRLVPARLVKTFPTGIKPVFTMRLASGRSVDATANHRFLTVDGWERLDALTPGSFVAVPRRVPAPLEQEANWSEDELILAAHLIGDGTMGPSFKYATSDPANKEVVEGSAWRLFGVKSQSVKQGNTWQVWFPSPRRLTHNVNHPMREWLEPHGLWGSRAWNKFVPPSIFGLTDAEVTLFLRHLWATDGSITLSRNGRGPVVRTYYASTSQRLALDVQLLLLRLGIRSTIGRSKKRRIGRPVNGSQFYRDGYAVRISGASNQARFLRTVGSYGQRGSTRDEALSILDNIKENPNVDLVPWGVASRIKAAAASAGVTHREIASALGEGYCGSYLLGSKTPPRRFSRSRLATIAKTLRSGELSDIASSDLYWDEVIEIIPVGDQPTFDATVDETHNFIANGIVAHNSLEQDADVVMFIYRDEIYNPESPDRGSAEIIISKHRNGPTGITNLAFLGDYTRFDNMARL
jgi:replicative DNA helicase